MCWRSDHQRCRKGKLAPYRKYPEKYPEEEVGPISGEPYDMPSIFTNCLHGGPLIDWFGLTARV